MDLAIDGGEGNHGMKGLARLAEVASTLVVGAHEPFAVQRLTVVPDMGRAAFDPALMAGRVGR